jgi:hypothetical protein
MGVPQLRLNMLSFLLRLCFRSKPGIRCSGVDDWCHRSLEADGGVRKVAYVVAVSGLCKGGNI